MIHAQMIAFTYIGDDSNRTFIKSKSFAKYTTTRSFEYSSLHVRMS